MEQRIASAFKPTATRLRHHFMLYMLQIYLESPWLTKNCNSLHDWGQDLLSWVIKTTFAAVHVKTCLHISLKGQRTCERLRISTAHTNTEPELKPQRQYHGGVFCVNVLLGIFLVFIWIKRSKYCYSSPSVDTSLPPCLFWGRDVPDVHPQTNGLHWGYKWCIFNDAIILMIGAIIGI